MRSLNMCFASCPSVCFHFCKTRLSCLWKESCFLFHLFLPYTGARRQSRHFLIHLSPHAGQDSVASEEWRGKEAPPMLCCDFLFCFLWGLLFFFAATFRGWWHSSTRWWFLLALYYVLRFLFCKADWSISTLVSLDFIFLSSPANAYTHKEQWWM